MSKWTRFLAAGGVTADGRRLINSSVIGTMVTPQFTTNNPFHANILEPFFPSSSFQSDYGFSWCAGTCVSQLAALDLPERRHAHVVFLAHT